MSSPSPLFAGNIPQNYEDYLGSFLFESYAADLAARINWAGINHLLELACGSGRLTRHLAQHLPPDVNFTATDLSHDMISLARSKVPSTRVTWSQADMMTLPFPGQSFDLVVCQFALMLVPDHQTALTEIRRILKPGGRLLFSTWTDLRYNTLWAIGDEVLKASLGKSPMHQNPGPFSLDDPDLVLKMLKNAGFTDPGYTTVTNTGETDTAQKAAYGFVYGLPIVLFIQKENPGILPAILRTLEDRIRTELGEHPLRTPQKALVFEAH